MRRLWARWKRRRDIWGKFYVVRIDGAWWRPRNRKAAKLAAKLADYHAPALADIANRALRDEMLYGHAVTETEVLWEESFKRRPGLFVPDEWPFPDDPPDPL